MVWDHTREVRNINNLPDFDSIFASPETEKGTKIFNEKRIEAGLQPIEVVLIEIVKSESDEGKVSSTDYRTFTARSISPDQFEALRTLWMQTLTESNVVEQDEAIVWFWRMVRKYSEEQRRYHTL